MEFDYTVAKLFTQHRVASYFPGILLKYSPDSKRSKQKFRR
jgi:hypothetical protein